MTDIFTNNKHKYSEFYTAEPNHKHICTDSSCSHCGLTARYTQGLLGQQGQTCQSCGEIMTRQFKKLEELKAEMALEPGERLGVTTSGGKDSIYALMKMVELFGPEHVAALTHHKVGLTDPTAEENLHSAVRQLGVELITVEETDMVKRFRQNLALLIKRPDPALVRVVLCAGCRYGITQDLYEQGKARGIHKYVSAASYLELAPFKEDLLASWGDGDADKGFRHLMQHYGEYYKLGDNQFYIERDNGYKYKSNRADDKGGLKDRLKDVKLFDLDNYLRNDPETIEREVSERLGWHRGQSGRSWHFDCIIEEVKDMFYYGLLGYTETDFKLSAMVRHGLLTVEEARHQLSVVRHGLAHSYPSMEQFFLSQGLGDCLPDLRRFYEESPYLCLDTVQQSSADSEKVRVA